MIVPVFLVFVGIHSWHYHQNTARTLGKRIASWSIRSHVTVLSLSPLQNRMRNLPGTDHRGTTPQCMGRHALELLDSTKICFSDSRLSRHSFRFRRTLPGSQYKLFCAGCFYSCEYLIKHIEAEFHERDPTGNAFINHIVFVTELFVFDIFYNPARNVSFAKLFVARIPDLCQVRQNRKWPRHVVVVTSEQILHAQFPRHYCNVSNFTVHEDFSI